MYPTTGNEYLNSCDPQFPKFNIFTWFQEDSFVSRSNRQIYPGGRLNKKDGLTRYGDSHVKDKTS